jgi:hypothetical protein
MATFIPVRTKRGGLTWINMDHARTFRAYESATQISYATGASEEAITALHSPEQIVELVRAARNGSVPDPIP